MGFPLTCVMIRPGCPEGFLHKTTQEMLCWIKDYLAATGARVSELIQIKIEHVELGYFDLYTKGGKLRRLYIPKKLRTETLEWLEETHRSSGYLFLNRYGERITTRGISQQLKNYADKYGLDKKVVYPHSFRHRYAKNFLEKYNDIALLADLMGHESIETTRIQQNTSRRMMTPHIRSSKRQFSILRSLFANWLIAEENSATNLKTIHWKSVRFSHLSPLIGSIDGQRKIVMTGKTKKKL